MRERPRARYLAMDEARFGLMTWHRRRWTPVGVRPPWIAARTYEWFWLYAAVEPTTGTSVCTYLPRLDGDSFEAFLGEIRRAFPDEDIVLVLDGAPAHRSRSVQWPRGIEPLRLPPYSPELDPVERWFQELRGALSNRVFASLQEQQAALTEALQPWWEDPERLSRLTGYPWWRSAIRQTPTFSN